MPRPAYDQEFVNTLRNEANRPALHFRPAPVRHESGDVLEVAIRGVWPDTRAVATLRLDRFIGGGFAGQVYRCTLTGLRPEPGGKPPQLQVGGTYKVKILVPPARGDLRFRNTIYHLAFQGPFCAQVNEHAARAGVLWQKLVRRAAQHRFERDDAIGDVHATFYDADLCAFGEIAEWVEGRTWRLEPDTRPADRRHWRTVAPAETGSPEFVAKRQFMAAMVELLHEMGGVEFARQYEWWTMKSQPNVLKRYDGQGPAGGLCAIDFRAGLALLPWLPMSPGDVALIARGVRDRRWVQFDHIDLPRLQHYVASHLAGDDIAQELFANLAIEETAYRRALPDITRQGVRLLFDARLRADVRQGLVDGYRAAALCDDTHAAALRARPAVFAGFYLLGAVPLLGAFVRRLRHHDAFHRHVRAIFGEPGYFAQFSRAGVARRLIGWIRAGRCGEPRARLLLAHPPLFWLTRLTLGLLPSPGLHRFLAEPAYARQRLRDGFVFVRDFYRDATFREQWLTDQVTAGHRDGMLSDEERDSILGQVKDPFIVEYLKCLAVHFMTLPVTQIVSVTLGTIVAAKILMTGGFSETAWKEAGAMFIGIVALFQVLPISPGSLCRGFYVLYRVIRERNFRDYMIAAPVSFVKYLGYLAFPLQMATTYPALSRFMAGSWATSAVHIIPVFGEKGALLEHMVFDLCFNRTRILAGRIRRHLRLLLDLWLLAGAVVLYAAFHSGELSLVAARGAQLTLAVVVVCFLPRLLFYPMLLKKSRTPPL